MLRPAAVHQTGALPAGPTRAAFLLFAGTAFGGRRLATPGQRVTYRVGVAGEIALAGAMAHMLLVMP